MKPRAHFGQSPMTQAQAMVQFKLFLANATDERLLAMTIDKALASYRIERRAGEYALLIAQQNRRAEIAAREKAA